MPKQARRVAFLVAFESRRPGFREGSERPWRPEATYTLLGLMVATLAAQWVTISLGGYLHNFVFVIDVDWYLRAWTLITSTLAHDPGDLMHILFNGLMLFFFGPTIERILGQRRFFTVFFLSGALSGVLQVHLEDYFADGGGALGASGALMCIFGISMILMPRSQILIWGILPMPLWIAGIAYAAIDVLGAFNPGDGVGNFAHLSGMAIGLVYGLRVKGELKQRGLQLVPN